MRSIVIFLLLIFYVVASVPITLSHGDDALEQQSQFRPVVMWHGMGDTCCNPQSMGFIKSIIEQYLPGVYVFSVEIGNSEEDDQWNGFFKNINEQVSLVCSQLASNPNLTNGFNAVGFSQGSQFLRAYIERCNSPPVYNLVSIGGQHQGVYGLPKCPGVNETVCEYIRELLDEGAYLSWVQSFLVQAEYWHDPFAEEEYVADCVFLPDINNEGDQKNETYKQNLISLNKFAMVQFTEDTMVQPIASEWFGFYIAGQDSQTQTLQQSDLYAEDWIGMQTLDKAGKLDFLSVVGDHLQFTEQWFIDVVIGDYLNNTVDTFY